MHKYPGTRVLIQYLTLAMLLLVANGVAVKASAQSQQTAGALEFAVGYNAIRANAPPGGCGCFYMQGARAEVDLRLHHWLSAVAEVGGAHADKINSHGDSVGRMTYLVGPRVTRRYGRRFSGFGQALVGAAHGFDGYFPTAATFSTTGNSFAFSTGGGVDVALSDHISARILQADYLYTQLPNAAGDRQNNVRLGAGLVFRIR